MTIFGFRIFLVASALVGLSACSPSIFFGSDQDEQVARNPGYRRVNTACAKMDLSSPSMDVPTLKQVVKCFNSTGAMEAIERLIETAPPQHIQAILETSNKYVLGDARTLYELDRTHAALQARGQLDESFRQLGRILENEEFISAAVALLKDGYQADLRTNGKLLKGFELLASKIEPGRVGRALDAGLTLAESRAFPELQARFRGSSPGGRALEEIARGLLAYSNGPGERGKALIRAVVENDLLEALDPVLGKTAGELRQGIPRMSSVLKATLAEDARLLGGISTLFHHLHREPIACLGGAKAVPDGVMHVIRELSEHGGGDASAYLRRSNVLTLAAMSPFCDYPAELGRYYPYLLELSDTSAMEPAAELLRSFYRAGKMGTDGVMRRPLAELLVTLLADPRMGLVAPALAELTDRGAWDGLLLVATLLPEENRADLKAALAELIVPRAELDGQSIYDVFGEAVAQASPAHLYNLLYSLRRFTESDESLLGPSLRVLRSAFHVNDAHPLIRVAHAMLRDASKNRALFDALFTISETPEFRDTVKLLSEMAKDGRLRDLTESVTVLYRKFSLAGRTEIAEGREPAFVPRRRHDLTVADLASFPVTRRDPEEDRACRRVDLGFRLDDYRSPRHPEQLSSLLACLNSDGRHDQVVGAVEFLRSIRVEDGRSLLELQIDSLKELKLPKEPMAYLVEQWMGAMDDGRFGRLLAAIPFWTKQPEPVLEPLFHALGAWTQASAREALARLREFGAGTLRREDFPAILRVLSLAVSAEPAAGIQARSLRFDERAIAEFVARTECRGSGAEERALELIRDFEDAVSTWDLPSGGPRRAWQWTEFRAGLEEYVETLGREHRAGGRRHAHEAMLALLRYFSLPEERDPGRDLNREQHYRPSDLLKYLRDRAVDYSPITYLYPGETVPRARLVNTLDRLELVLLNADFVAPYLKKNFGIKFLADIGEAWGDEPEAIWPEEIRDKRARGAKIKTLTEVVDEIERTQALFEKLVGFPLLPDCASEVGGGGLIPGMGEIKPHIYNIRQVVSVLRQERENGGLRVLRDLFFEVHSSTPTKFRDSKSTRNHLRMVMQLVRMGIFRNLGRAAMAVPENDPVALAMIRGLIEASTAPEAKGLMDALLVKDPKRELAWKLIESVFKALESDSGAHRGELRRLAVYFGANVSALKLGRPLARTLQAVVEREGALLSRHAELLDVLFVSPELGRIAQSLHEVSVEGKDPSGMKALEAWAQEALSDPGLALELIGLARAIIEDKQASESFTLFADRVGRITALPDYKRLRLGELLGPWVRFLAEDLADRDPRAVQAARRLRGYFADQLAGQNAEQILLTAIRNPERMSQALSAVGTSVEVGEISELLKLVRRSLEGYRF